MITHNLSEETEFASYKQKLHGFPVCPLPAADSSFPLFPSEKIHARVVLAHDRFLCHACI